MVEVMKIMVTSFKRSHACTGTLRAPKPIAGHHRPTPLLETPGHSRASLGQCLLGSLLLSPGSWCTRFCCALQESISQYCVSSGSSLVGLMVTSSKRAYAIPRSTAPRALSLWQSTVDPYLHRRCSNTVLSQSLWGPWVLVYTGSFEPTECLWREWGLILNTNLPLLPSCWGFSFALGCGVCSHSCSPSYWGFSDLGRAVSPHSCSSKAQSPLLSLNMSYLLTAACSSAVQLPCSSYCE